MYEYHCKIVRVIDGDTVDVDIDLGFGVWLKKERVRVYGIDTPESRTRDKEEKKYGFAAKKYVKDFLSDSTVTLVTKEYDAKGKFGRILGDLVIDSSFKPEYIEKGKKKRYLSEEMIKMYHAVEYHGQSKEDIREAHLANRKFVNVE